MVVRYLGNSVEQARWRGHDDARQYLHIGGLYTVETRKVYDWYTVLVFVGYPDLRFNSVWFEEVHP